MTVLVEVKYFSPQNVIYMQYYRNTVINSKSSLISAILVLFGIALGCVLSGESFDTALAQGSNNKTAIFDTFVIRLDDNGFMENFDFDRQVINGTNEQLTEQFPAVLKKAHDLAPNSTKNDVAFVDYQTGNSTVLPYQNITTQTYLSEFRNSLEEIDRIGGDPTVKRCWIIYSNGEGKNIHVHRCW